MVVFPKLGLHQSEYQRQDHVLGLGQYLLRQLDAGGADRGGPRRTPALQRPALRQNLARRRRLRRESGPAFPEPLAPAPRRPEVDVEEARVRG